jgi:hypothetical protein
LWEQIDVRRTSVLGNMTLVLCDSGTAAWTEQIYKLRWFHTCVSRELSFDKAFTACSISASGVYLLHLSGIFLLFAKANDGFLNPQNQVTVALVTLLFSRTAAWTEQFHKLRWVQTCVAHSLSIDQAITACSIPTTCVYLLPLQWEIVFSEESNEGFLNQWKLWKRRGEKLSMGGHTWIVIYFFCFAVDSTDNWGGVGWVAVHFNHYQS